MWVIGGILIYLAIAKDFEPALLLPMGFGAILVNIPMSGAITQTLNGTPVEGILDFLFESGISTEAFPLLLFIWYRSDDRFRTTFIKSVHALFGAAAQFGIFFTVCAAALLGFELKDAASIGIIGAADGPTSIFVANYFHSNLIAPITVAAYSYMSLVPVIQPFAIKLVTTKKERAIRMPYKAESISKMTRILFPITVTVIAGLIAPTSVALVGFLMFGNLIRECGVIRETIKNSTK
jgi:oxaloacetate decarboxylase beta subunit